MVLIGPNGLGKTMLLKNLAHQAVLQRLHRALYPGLRHAPRPRRPGLHHRAARRLRRYTSPAILAIDEVGYLSYDARYADLLFEVVTRRYELRRPILLTTNKVFGEWNQVFPNAACVVTLVDRLVHRAEIVALEGKSYRLKEAQERAAAQSQIPQPSRAQGALEHHAATQRSAPDLPAHRALRRGGRQPRGVPARAHRSPRAPLLRTAAPPLPRSRHRSGRSPQRP